MRHAIAPFSVLFLASIAAAPTSTGLAFGVAKGTKLSKHFEMSMELETKSVSIKIGGRELPKELAEKIEMTMSAQEKIEVEDEYADVDGARTKELVRTYKAGTKHSKRHFVMMGAEPQDESEDSESPLVDHTVAFTWNAKEDKYETALRGDKGDSKWLEKLKEDMDCKHILPDHDVEVGDTWKIDPKVFNELVLPGGSLPYEDKDRESDMDLEKNLTGESHAKYGGTREVDGRKLAVIALEGKFSTHVDPKETDELKGSGEIEFSLEGELLWDPEARHFASYELSGPMQFTLKAHQEVEAHGQTLELDLKFALEGEMKAKGGL